MKTVAAFFIVLIFTGASADETTYSGSVGFDSATATVGAYCPIGYDVPHVLANSDVWQNGQTCGEVITIYCNDPSNCTPSSNIQVVIVNVCDTCGSTFTLSGGDFSGFAPNAVTGVVIEYQFNT